MKIIVVDDERLALENFVEVLHRVEKEAEIICFLDSVKAGFIILVALRVKK